MEPLRDTVVTLGTVEPPGDIIVTLGYYWRNTVVALGYQWSHHETL